MEGSIAELAVAPVAEIAHVLFLDIVGYSRESTTAQAQMISDLNLAVNSSPAFKTARAKGQVLPLPTGDGMALVFFQDVTLPASCSTTLAPSFARSGLPVRMGIHSGLVQRQFDISGHENVSGEGINTAQRVMDLGDAGHILMSSQYASWLDQFEDWKPHIRPLGVGEAKHGLSIQVFQLVGDGYGRTEPPSRLAVVAPAHPNTKPLKLVILYKRLAQPDERVMEMLETGLRDLSHDVFIDRHLKIGVEWAKAIEERIRGADAVIALVSDAAIRSEMLEYELEIAADESQKTGKPQILPVRIGNDRRLEGSIGAIINPLNFCVWTGPADDRKALTEIVSALTAPLKPLKSDREFEPVGGAVPPDSPYYIERSSDGDFMRALRANESILLVKGPRQVGKTSLIGRGIKAVSDLGWRHAATDFQKLSSSQLASEDAFYQLLAATIARQLKFKYDFQAEWLTVFGANMNLENFIRAAIEEAPGPLVWFMDEADKLFGAPYASDFFGLVRSWHNSRATEPEGPWKRFTVVIGYATEAHLFIQDLNQSPFNVGRNVELPGFSLDEMKEMNQRYGSPLRSGSDVAQIFELIAGQPFLSRRAFDVLARGQMTLSQLLATADRDDGPFGDHLKRVLISVSQLPQVMEALKSSAVNPAVQESDGYQRLVSGGILVHADNGQLKYRCELYRRYLQSHVN